MKYFNYRIFLSLLFLFAHTDTAVAVEIVRLELEYGGDGLAGDFAFPKVNKSLDLELYDDQTPITVANYLDYVDSQLYDLTFFNRSIPGFVIQTGGVTNISSDPENEPLGSSFGEVPKFSPIPNESGLSNLRGTIAMAKINDQPDSATSEWYINLTDNSDPLDTDNGGYTVFGSVVDDGIVIADEIASFPTQNLSFLFGSSYSNIPFADYDPFGSELLYQRNLVMIISVRSITRPIIRSLPLSGNLGKALVGDINQTILSLELRNTGNEPLEINSINDITLTAPFNLLSDNCTASTLDPVSVTPNSFCVIEFEFTPLALGYFSNNLTVDYTSTISSDAFSVAYEITAEGILGNPEIQVNKSLDLGVSQINGLTSAKEIIVESSGLASLEIDSISGLDATDFSQTNNCTGSGNYISVGDSCSIYITYSARLIGETSAMMTLNTNDPVNPIVEILLTGFGDFDTDGIPASVELSGPNAGDANNDEISDGIQNNVATFLTASSNYITLVSDNATIPESGFQVTTSLREVIAIGAIPTNAPTDSSYDYGLIGFNVDLSGFDGAIVNVGLFLPIGVKPAKFYRYGPTPDNTTPHWYDFAFDSSTQTGAQFIGNVTIQTPTGASVDRNMIILSFIDGAKGDDDLTANGIIVQGTGGVSFSQESDSSGSAVYLWMLALVLVLRLYGNKEHHKVFIS